MTKAERKWLLNKVILLLNTRADPQKLVDEVSKLEPFAKANRQHGMLKIKTQGEEENEDDQGNI